MVHINILLIALIMVLNSFSSGLYDEPYRPQLHFSPPVGWMNDPNGLVYHDGIFHLFYQHDPKTTIQGQMHWGHAISTDMIYWTNLDIALTPPKGIAYFSGGAIIDYNNVTGFQMSANVKPLIAIFTAHNRATYEQEQWLAYSNDGPEYKHFELYENNPIIGKLNTDPSKPIDFRDPAITKWGDHFVLFLAQYNKSLIYNSLDLKNWELVGDFGEYDGSHSEVWECPSLFPLNVTINGVNVEKHVLIVGLTGSVLPTTQYFIGSFDGKKFTNENSPETTLWVDYGPDSYAGITYNQLPDGRRVFVSWMNKWEYAEQLNFNVWNGQMGLMRELKLKQVGDQTRLVSYPVREEEKLRTYVVRKENIKISTNRCVYKITPDGKTKHTVDMEITLDVTDLKKGDSIEFTFFDKNDNLTISLTENEFTLERNNTGRTNFSNFTRPLKAPRLIDSPELKLRIIIDRSSIEFFADDGLTVMSALFFSDEDIASKIAIQVYSSLADSIVHLKNFNAYQMKSIWN
uniref:MDL6 n=1 Tax=Mayetiola destructor TaxID=39758 RepID=A0A7S5SLX4_MAYDE|nr:MDL6 [Mayetiola destructor]